MPHLSLTFVPVASPRVVMQAVAAPACMSIDLEDAGSDLKAEGIVIAAVDQSPDN